MRKGTKPEPRPTPPFGDKPQISFTIRDESGHQFVNVVLIYFYIAICLLPLEEICSLALLALSSTRNGMPEISCYFGSSRLSIELKVEIFSHGREA